jgi:DNA ligase (NAD+)
MMREQALKIINSDGKDWRDIVPILQAASDEYNNDGESFLEDSEFDRLEYVLRQFDPSNAWFKVVGSDVRTGKTTLPYQMGGLDQVFENDTEKWIKASGWQNEDFIITDKLDGTSALLIYEGGKLTFAYSRGNGIKGADITRHLRKMNVPQTIPAAEHIAIRCEVVVKDQTFADIATQLKNRGGRAYKTPRAFTAGQMNSSVAEPLFYEHAEVIATSLVASAGFKGSKEDSIKFIEWLGLSHAFYRTMVGIDCSDISLQEFLSARRIHSPWAIDGLVIDLNDGHLRRSIAERNGSSLAPLWAKKFKVADSSNLAIGKVVKVHWAASKQGYLKPRIQIEPVELVGTTVQYCTAFNAGFISQNKIGPGSEIEITKSGDVIPFVQKILKSTYADMPTEAEFGEMAWNETNVDLVMLEDNDESVINRLIAVFMDLEIPNLREGSITTLYEQGFDTASAIIKLPEETLVKLIGENGKKIFAGLKAKLNPVPLGILAGSSQVFPRGIGRRKMTKLVEGLSIQNPEDFRAVTSKQIAFIDGFDRITAEKVIEGIPKFLDFLSEIEGYYTLATKAAPMSDEFAGRVFCFTGFRDKESKAEIQKRGGDVADSITKSVTDVVTEDPNSTSGKLVKARQAGLHILSRQELSDLLD